MKTQRHPHTTTIFGSDRQLAPPNEITMDYNGDMGGEVILRMHACVQWREGRGGKTTERAVNYLHANSIKISTQSMNLE